MSNVKIVFAGQSFLDKVLETTGSIDNALEMSILNGVSITDNVIVGEELQVLPISNKVVVSYFNEFNRPATAISGD